MTTSSVGARGIPVAISRELPPPRQPISPNGEARGSRVAATSPKIVPSTREAEQVQRLVIAPEVRATPSQQQPGRLIDRVV